MKNMEMVHLTIKFFSGLDEVWLSGHASLALIARHWYTCKQGCGVGGKMSDSGLSKISYILFHTVYYRFHTVYYGNIICTKLRHSLPSIHESRKREGKKESLKECSTFIFSETAWTHVPFNFTCCTFVTFWTAAVLFCPFWSTFWPSALGSCLVHPMVGLALAVRNSLISAIANSLKNGG